MKTTSTIKLSLLHTSGVSTSAIAIASARTFTLEHKRRKQGGLYLALTIALTFCRFTLEDFWHKRNRKRKTSTRKTKLSFFLRLRLRLRFSRFTLDFFCVAIVIALALTSLVWSRLNYEYVLSLSVIYFFFVRPRRPDRRSTHWNFNENNRHTRWFGF